MKILHVNISDSIGGASKAAYRLHKSLRKIGVDSHMLVFNKDTDDNTVISLKNKKQKIFLEIRRYIENKILNRYSHRVRIIFSLSLLRNRHLIKKINNINPDIVHLHWVNGGLLGIIDLLKIKRKIVWSMHDNWIISGGCHIKWDCEKYKTICSECPILKSKKKHDLSKLIFILKRSVYNKINNITFIALSSWLYNCSKKSLLLKEKNIIHLPNPINTKFFKKIDKKNARKICNLELKCKIILFGAMNATSDRNKGFNILYKALETLNCNKSNKIELVVFGSSDSNNNDIYKFKTHFFGELHDDISLVTLYNSADVVVVPSLQENLSNVIMESMSCGVPVVAFNIGGNSDLIDHCINGYLAQPYNAADLANGILWIINNSDYKTLSDNAQRKIIDNFQDETVAKRYNNLYSNLKNDIYN